MCMVIQCSEAMNYATGTLTCLFVLAFLMIIGEEMIKELKETIKEIKNPKKSA